MTVSRHLSFGGALLGLLLAGCRPFGCDSDECVTAAPYARMKHCYAVTQAAVYVVSLPEGKSVLRGSPSLLTGEAMGYLNLALKEGRGLGQPRERVYSELERERQSTVRPFASGRATSEQYTRLAEQAARCKDGEDL